MRASVFSFCLRNPTEMFQAHVDTPIRPKNEKTLQKYLTRHTQDINKHTFFSKISIKDYHSKEKLSSQKSRIKIYSYSHYYIINVNKKNYAPHNLRDKIDHFRKIPYSRDKNHKI